MIKLIAAVLWNASIRCLGLINSTNAFQKGSSAAPLLRTLGSEPKNLRFL